MDNHNPSPEPDDDELDDRELYGEETEIIDLDQPTTRQPLFYQQNILPAPRNLLLQYGCILGPFGVFLLTFSQKGQLLNPEWTTNPEWVDFLLVCVHAPAALCFAFPVLAAVLCFTSDFPDYPKPQWISIGLLLGLLLSIHEGLLWPLIYLRTTLSHSLKDPFSLGAGYMIVMVLLYLFTMGTMAIVETLQSRTTMISGTRLLPLGLFLAVIEIVLACFNSKWAEFPGRIAYMLVPYIGIAAYFRLYVRSLSPEGRLSGSRLFARRYWGFAFLLYAIVLNAIIVIFIMR